MFCPRCGQQQVTDEMRFCSRCGFQLVIVTALIATGGLPPDSIDEEAIVKSELAKRRRTRQGAKVMFAGGVLMALAMGLSILVDSPEPLIFPFMVFLAGLTWMLYFRWFGKDESNSRHQAVSNQLGGVKQVSLPPAQSDFVSNGVRAAHRTAEIVRPPSITEHTTTLLDGKEN